MFGKWIQIDRNERQGKGKCLESIEYGTMILN